MIFSPRPPNPPGFVELSANAHHTVTSTPPFRFDPMRPAFQPSLKTIQALGDFRARAVVSPIVTRLELAREQRQARRMDPYGVQFLRETTYTDIRRQWIDYDSDLTGITTSILDPEIPCIEMADAFETGSDDAGGVPMDGIEDTTLVEGEIRTLWPIPPSFPKGATTPSPHSQSSFISQPTTSASPHLQSSYTRRHSSDQFSRGRCSICSRGGKHRLATLCDSDHAPLYLKVKDEDGDFVWVSKLQERPDACCDFNRNMPCATDCPTDSHWCSLCAEYTHGAQDCPLYFRYVGDGEFEARTRSCCSAPHNVRWHIL